MRRESSSDKTGKLTSREIARLAGVSVSTVSLVRNGKGGVSEETRKTILSLMEQSGHPRTPDFSLRRGIIRFCKISKHGQIVNERHNAFINDYTDGIIEEARQNGMTVEVTVFNGENLKQVRDELKKAWNLTGCIILATEFSPEDIGVFSDLPCPAVFLDSFYDFSPCDFVTMDNANMIYDMVKHFYSLGHKDIGLLYNEGGGNFLQRKIAFTPALEAFGLTAQPQWMLSVGSTLESAELSMARHIQYLGGKLPGAFVACNDIIAIGAITALQRKGFRVPHDVSVGGFDDIPVASFAYPPLTTISVPKFDIGRLGVTVLLDKVRHGTKGVCKKCLLKGSLVSRKSTGPKK